MIDIERKIKKKTEKKLGERKILSVLNPIRFRLLNKIKINFG